MTIRLAGARLWAAGLAALAILAAGAVILLAKSGNGALPARAESQRPTLLLLTSLPLIFGERFGLESGGSKALEALETRYRVAPISLVDEDNIKAAGLLFMAHARAQPAESLVTLDQWVRDGGKLLLLADPMLEWHSERPLGDPMRPSPMFPDTGLLAHWGLRLDTPERRGAAVRAVGEREIVTLSPGALAGRCNITKDRLIADCRIGKGRAIIVADADFLDVDRLGERAAGNLESLLVLLSRLEDK